MKTVAWLMVIGTIAGLGFWLWRVRTAWIERKQASEARLSSFVVSAHVPPAAAVPLVANVPKFDAAALATQKLLFDAAAKAGEAGEPALAIQLYAKLLSRFPDTALAAQARAAVDAQKKKFSKH